VEGDNWMITQQVASYLIKKMMNAVQNPSKQSADPTDDLFKQYLSERSRKSPQDVISNGRINNDAIVEAFRWRAADLVGPLWYHRPFNANEHSSRVIKHTMQG
jgi:acyl-CoA oxidase